MDVKNKILITILFALSILVFMPNMAKAEDWVETYQNETLTNYFDNDSYEYTYKTPDSHKGKQVSFKTLTKLKEPFPYYTAVFDAYKGHVHYIETDSVIDCDIKKIICEKEKYFDASYKKLKKKTYKNQKPILPETIYMLIYDQECKATQYQEASNFDKELDEYMLKLQNKIKANWSPGGSKSRELVIVFRLNRQGELLWVKPIHTKFFKTKSYKAALTEARKAIKESSPFAPPPKAITTDDFVDIGFTFDYNVIEDSGIVKNAKNKIK